VRPVWRLVWPVLVEQLLGLSVGFTDKWLAGNLLEGAEPLAAVGLVAYCLSFLPALFAVPAVAVTALVARSVGAADWPAARRAVAQSLLVAAVLVVGILGGLAVIGPSLLDGLGLAGGSTALAGRYLSIVVPTLPAMIFLHVGVAALRGAGDMRAGLVSMTVVNLVNAGASFALAVGLAGLPRMGWEGLAWGTTAGYALGAACVAWFLFRRRAALRPRRDDWRPDVGWLRRVLHVGLPAGADAVGNAACHLAFLSIVNRLGDVAAAAHSVAITIESLAFLPGSAFMVAAATLAGQALGAGDPRRAKRSVWQAALACLGLMTVAGGCFVAAADPLAGWFVGGRQQSEVAPLAARLVRIVACVQPPLALLMVFSGAVRGAGATRIPMVVNFTGLLLIRLPLALWLARDSVLLPGGAAIAGLGLSVVGAWYAMAADLTFRGAAMLVIFLRGRWARVAV
jgi:putative MATE family efflux protein